MIGEEINHFLNNTALPKIVHDQGVCPAAHFIPSGNNTTISYMKTGKAPEADGYPLG